MKIKFKIMLLILCCGSVQLTLGQTNEDEKARMTLLIAELEGTYQVQMVNTRSLPALSLAILDRIADERLQLDTVYLNPTPNMKVMVLPESIISQPGFVPPIKTVYKLRKE